ncbi:hypothetical protein HYH02_003897 [Chlamydomonas schloesseri]|uniref:Ubiquitin-like domain-containing protein n=1 Tax=Chlamydomonas schloesseri TaxID=2026947 RepID=A0A835WQZ8_9CHLO|nr:hypothetical protein HYH02_003897 [Chlamydomonas schloesseri]|eukprot:KAG2451291.1 hypothetical protein HYH02_003897 [Chlamydomonas schloesseri]
MAESLWTIHVKHGPQNLELQLDAASKVSDLHERLQTLTGAFVRKQKLIHKGKVLAPNLDLAKAGLGNGAKLMLLLSDAGAVPTQGQAALQQAKKAKQEEAAARVKELYAQAKGMGGAASAAIAAAAAADAARAAAAAVGPAIDWSERKRNWEKTGIISLRDLGLTSAPDDLFEPTPASTSGGTGAANSSASGGGPGPGLAGARVADLSHNRLQRLPASLARLTCLHTLRLDRNGLTSGAMPWEALGSLTGLTVLTLSGNQLDSVPGAAVSGLKALQVLSLNDNQLPALPEALGALTVLEVLTADDNKLEFLPASLGGCAALSELSAERNLIRELPEQLGQLQKLRSLRLDSNRIAAVPPHLLQDCASLAVLSLQDNPITADQLRSTPGFKDYDARRVALCNKQLGAKVSAHATRTFTEGAEDRQWQRYATGQGGGSGGPSGGGR